MPGNRCSNCISYNYDCTYLEAAKVILLSAIFVKTEESPIETWPAQRVSRNLASPIDSPEARGLRFRYVEGLEKRLESMEKLLRKVRARSLALDSCTNHVQWKLCPDEEMLNDINAKLDPDQWQVDILAQPLDKEHNTDSAMRSNNPTDIITKVLRQSGSLVPASSDPHDDDDDFVHMRLAGAMRQLSMDPIHHRFFGKSSGAMLAQAAIDLKRELTKQDDGPPERLLGARRPEFWNIRPVRTNVPPSGFLS
jgi:hypothetical protein